MSPLQNHTDSDDVPTDENGLTYVVITDGDGGFPTGSILICAPLPGVGVREIGYPGRKPMKGNADYEYYGDPQEAVDRREELRPTTRNWVPVSEDYDGD